MRTDPRNHYWGPEGFVPTPDEEFDVSVVFVPGAKGPDAYRWHLESEVGTLCDCFDLGGSHFWDVDHWLAPLTGYTREEFLELIR